MISPSTTSYLTSFASENSYALLSGYALSQHSSSAWYIAPSIALSNPISLGQKILLTSPTSSRTYFGRFKSVLSLEKSYVILSVAPVPSAYGPFLPPPCHVYIPLSFITLPRIRQFQYSVFKSFLNDFISDRFDVIAPLSHFYAQEDLTQTK